MADSTQPIATNAPLWDEDLVCAALANPLRRQYLALLAQGKPMTVDDLRKHVKCTVGGTRKHLEYLREAGLIAMLARGERDGRRREYALQPAVPVMELPTGRVIDLGFIILNC